MRKLAACPRLRAEVEAKLEERWSPEEISGWLARTFGDDLACERRDGWSSLFHHTHSPK
ncbi:MAG: hypothetical protein ACYCVN_03935 [Acidimicrobiales bacterium]